ncbi:MAG: hypothetical protein AB1489_42960 [Acidobacteriota bacterium]
MIFDRNKFWEKYTQTLKNLAERIREEEKFHVDSILNLAESDSRLISVTQLAYMMTTARWETDRYTALFERGNDQYLSQYQGKGGNTEPGDYKKYRGTGYVHLTFRDNFRRAGQKLGIDLENNPELAAEPQWAYEIMVRGHLEGWFTGKKLGDFVSADGNKQDYRNARKVINPGELSIADKAPTTGEKTKRQCQCIEAIDTQIKWANAIEKCLQSSLIDSSSFKLAAMEQPYHSPTPERELKPLPPVNVIDDDIETSNAALVVTSVNNITAPTNMTTIPPNSVTEKKGFSETVKNRELPQLPEKSTKHIWATLSGCITSLGTGISAFIKAEPIFSAIIIIVSLLAVVWLITYFIHAEKELDKKRLEIAAGAKTTH